MAAFGFKNVQCTVACDSRTRQEEAKLATTKKNLIKTKFLLKIYVCT